MKCIDIIKWLNHLAYNKLISAWSLSNNTYGPHYMEFTVYIHHSNWDTYCKSIQSKTMLGVLQKTRSFIKHNEERLSIMTEEDLRE
jgi:hypothetical protein